MALDPTTPRSRRALLTAAVAATAVTVVETVARPVHVSADNGDHLVIGFANSAAVQTTLTNSVNGNTVLQVNSASAGHAVHGVSGSGIGVWGYSSDRGVYGSTASGFGVMGYSVSGIGVYARSDSGVGLEAYSFSGTAIHSVAHKGIAVHGVSTSGIGVHGVSESSAGVSGHATTGVGVHGVGGDGTGVLAESTSGTALNVIGKTHFNRSGKATVPAGHRSVDVTVPGGLGGTPLCFANIRIYRSGVAVAAVRPNWPSSGKIRIYLTKVMTSSTSVSWMVMD